MVPVLRSMRLMGVVLALCLVSAVLALAQVRFDSEPLVIETKAGARHQLLVELAVDPAQREQGLMHRKEMAADHGMLFDFKETRSVSMWMRNTLIPLDMLFLDTSGTITHIHQGAQPLSEAIISSGGPVKYVLELNGDAVKAMKISVGDRVISRQIGNDG